MGIIDTKNVMLIALGILAGGMPLAGAVDYYKRRKLEQQRCVPFLNLSAELGLEYQPGNNRTLQHRHPFIRGMARGTNRHGTNTLAGEYAGNQVHVFDYHHETDSVVGKEKEHHYLSVLLIQPPANFPELIIAHEGNVQSLFESLGFGDINFESLEFFSEIYVKSESGKFACDIRHPRMMEYLLANLDLEFDTIALIFNRRLKPEQIQTNLERLTTVRSHIPDYLLNTA